MNLSRFAYQITARHEDGTFTRCLFKGQPLHFGSGNSVDLCLTAEDIPVVAGRFVPGFSASVMIINLGMPQMTLDDSIVPVYQPIAWKPDSVLCVGRYRLGIALAESGKLSDEASRAVIQSAAAVTHSAVSRSASRREASATLVPSQAVNIVENEAETEPAISTRVDDRETERTLVVSEISHAQPLEVTLKPIDRGNKSFTPVALEPKPSPAKAVSAVVLEDTRLKNWQTEGRLSVQLGMETLNFVPGERVRIPLLVHNHHHHPVELMTEITDIPASWAVDSRMVQALPGQIKALDVVLQTRPCTADESINARIRIYDQSTPQISINFPIVMALKPHPDLVGWLDKPLADEFSLVLLNLQNYALSTVQVMLTAYSESIDIRVSVPQPQVELTPDQILAIPLRFHVLRRRWLGQKSWRFGVTAQLEKWTPLDYAGSLQVRSRLWL